MPLDPCRFEPGLARFDVPGLNTDRELVRSLAGRLAEKGPEATRIRTAVRRTIPENRQPQVRPVRYAEAL